jgi:hypothetical protein
MFVGSPVTTYVSNMDFRVNGNGGRESKGA